jgi:hypothetical protein
MGKRTDWLWMLFVLGGGVVLDLLLEAEGAGIGFMVGCLVWRSAQRPV